MSHNPRVCYRTQLEVCSNKPLLRSARIYNSALAMWCFLQINARNSLLQFSQQKRTIRVQLYLTLGTLVVFTLEQIYVKKIKKIITFYNEIILQSICLMIRGVTDS